MLASPLYMLIVNPLSFQNAVQNALFTSAVHHVYIFSLKISTCDTPMLKRRMHF